MIDFQIHDPFVSYIILLLIKLPTFHHARPSISFLLFNPFSFICSQNFQIPIYPLYEFYTVYFFNRVTNHISWDGDKPEKYSSMGQKRQN